MCAQLRSTLGSSIKYLRSEGEGVVRLKEYGGRGGGGVQLQAYLSHKVFSVVRYKIKIKRAIQIAKSIHPHLPVHLKSAK